MTNEFSAVVFDLDGTLLDTLHDVAHSANGALASRGFATHPVDAYRLFVGDGVTTLFERALPRDQRQDKIIRDCVEGFRAEYGRNWNVHTRPYDGVAELLRELTARQIKMAVLSNKPDEFTQRCVQGYFPEIAFAMVLGQQTGIPRKPDPTGALKIIEQLGVLPRQVAYLGDTAIDMQTARAAGTHAVGALWGFRSRQELSESGAAALIEHPGELLSLFDEPGR